MKPNEHELRRWIAFIGEMETSSFFHSYERENVIATACKFALAGEPTEPITVPTVPEIVARIDGIDERLRAVEAARVPTGEQGAA